LLKQTTSLKEEAAVLPENSRMQLQRNWHVFHDVKIKPKVLADGANVCQSMARKTNFLLALNWL